MKRDERKRERYSMTGFILVYNAGGPVEFERKENNKKVKLTPSSSSLY